MSMSLTGLFPIGSKPGNFSGEARYLVACYCAVGGRIFPLGLSLQGENALLIAKRSEEWIDKRMATCFSATQYIVAINNNSPRNSSEATNPYAFFHEFISILSEPSVIFRISIPEQNICKQEAFSEFHIEVAPQNIRKIIDALTQAEELQKEIGAVANTDLVQKLNQANREIAARISQELPAMVLLAFIEDYCQKQAKVLTQKDQQRREHIRKGENSAVSCFLIGALFMAFVSILFIIQYQNSLLFLLLLTPGLCWELAGVYCLRINAARRRTLDEILRQRTTLHRLRMAPLILAEISSQEKKQAMMQELLLSLLN